MAALTRRSLFALPVVLPAAAVAVVAAPAPAAMLAVTEPDDAARALDVIAEGIERLDAAAREAEAFWRAHRARIEYNLDELERLTWPRLPDPAPYVLPNDPPLVK